MPFCSRRIRVVVAWVVVVAAGLLAGAWGYYSERELRIRDIIRAARSSALAMTVPEVAKLTGTRADERTDYYEHLRKRLAAMHAVHPPIHCIYIFRVDRRTGDSVCLIDSVPVDSPEHVRPGDELLGDMPETLAFKTLSEGVVTFRESLTDMFGVWAVAYARIEDGQNRNLMRLDMDMRGWRWDLLEEAFGRVLYVWLLLGVPLSLYLTMQRNVRQTRSIEQFRVAVEQSPAGMAIMNEQGVIQYVNQSLCDMSKFTREELIGRHWLKASEGLDQDKLQRLMRASEEGKIWIEDFEFERKNGEKYSGRNMSTPVRDASGKIIAYISVVTDMTELIRRADELREAKERAEAADKAKSIFLATMSHEVRTPLNGILGFSDLLIDTEMTAEQREYVHAIYSSGEALMRLMQNVLDFTQIEAGRLKIAHEAADVRDVIADVLENLAPPAARKNLALRQNVAPDVPAQVMLDPARLRQVLVNLVGNAIKFTPSGEVEVTVRMLAPASSMPGPGATLDGGKTPMMEFSVRDTGIGIAAEDQNNLFKSFVQIDSSCARQYEGAGLGLAISSDLVRLMGGRGISVMSEKGKGATFMFGIQCRECPLGV